jgi:NAD(P)-dependent dehydrogenase (short-subunit alcohol dehydrogenase family)
MKNLKRVYQRCLRYKGKYAMKKTCLVTGGANGIGRAITERFLEEGYFVAVIDKDKTAGEALVERLGADRALFFHGDISQETAIEEFVNLVISVRGSVDVLVNNACFSMGGLENCSYEDFNHVLRVGVSGPFYLSKLLMPYFVQGASIINISSTRAMMSQPNTESYTAAKGGICALTHAMSITLAGKVRVNSISPGWIDTGAYQEDEGYIPKHSQADLKQHPAGRIGTPEDIAQAALFLASDKASFISGENITVDGGMTKLMVYHGDFGWKYNP